MIIGVVGLSHLGLVSSIAFSKKKIKVLAFDKNIKNIVRDNKVISISEPKLDKNLKSFLINNCCPCTHNLDVD